MDIPQQNVSIDDAVNRLVHGQLHEVAHLGAPTQYAQRLGHPIIHPTAGIPSKSVLQLTHLRILRKVEAVLAKANSIARLVDLARR